MTLNTVILIGVCKHKYVCTNMFIFSVNWKCALSHLLQKPLPGGGPLATDT